MQSPSPSAAPSPHLAVRPDWLDRRREELIEPDLPANTLTPTFSPQAGRGGIARL